MPTRGPSSITGIEERAVDSTLTATLANSTTIPATDLIKMIGWARICATVKANQAVTMRVCHGLVDGGDEDDPDNYLLSDDYVATEAAAPNASGKFSAGCNIARGPNTCRVFILNDSGSLATFDDFQCDVLGVT